MRTLTLPLAAIALLFLATVPTARAPLAATTEDADGPPRDVVEMETIKDTPLYYAPGKQIGTFKTGAVVKRLKIDGEWAFVKHVGDKVVVQGWVAAANLVTASDQPTDPLRGLEGQRN